MSVLYPMRSRGDDDAMISRSTKTKLGFQTGPLNNLKHDKKTIIIETRYTDSSLRNPCALFHDKLPIMSKVIEERYKQIKGNFLKDLIFGGTFKYPFLGLIEVFTNKVYWKYISFIAGSYIMVFLVVGVIMYVCFVIPLMPVFMGFLGPIGIILLHVQWYLQTNGVTSYVQSELISKYLRIHIFDTALILNGGNDMILNHKSLKPLGKNTSSDVTLTNEKWTNDKILSLSIASLKTGTRMALWFLNLVPIVGPIVLNQINARRRALGYLSRYFDLQRLPASEIDKFKYKHLGLLWGFGSAAGLLELIPFFSCISNTAGLVGAAKWSTKLYDTNQFQGYERKSD